MEKGGGRENALKGGTGTQRSGSGSKSTQPGESSSGKQNVKSSGDVSGKPYVKLSNESKKKNVTEKLPTPKEAIGSKKMAVKGQEKSSLARLYGRSPQSAVGRSIGSGVNHSSLSSGSVLGKVRIPTIRVNPQDMPTTLGSERSWTNKTIGGRRKPSEAELKVQTEAQIKRMRKAIFIAGIVSTVTLILLVTVMVSLFFALSESAKGLATSSGKHIPTPEATESTTAK